MKNLSQIPGSYEIGDDGAYYQMEDEGGCEVMQPVACTDDIQFKEFIVFETIKRLK